MHRLQERSKRCSSYDQRRVCQHCKLMNYSRLITFVFSITFIVMAIYVFVGYSIESPIMLACSIWSFVAALAQVIETVGTLQEKGRKLFLKKGT